MGLNHIVNGSPVEVKHINRNSSAVNYVTRNGKLVFAARGLYLSGPVNYAVSGSPTIVDGIFSTTSYNDRLGFSSPVMFSSNNFEIGTKVVLDSISSGQRIICNGAGASVYSGLHFSSSGSHLDFLFYDTVSQEQYRVISSVTSVVNTPYYVKVCRQGTVLGISVSEDKQNWTTDTLAIPETANIASGSSYAWSIGAASQSFLRGSLDLNETYIKINGDLWFYGKNYASQNIAPVPSGYTYGTTTTNAIGFVDMRTQQFTAAPAGAVLGKDE